MNLDEHVLQELEAVRAGGRPITIGDLARHCGISTVMARHTAQRLVDNGQATAVTIDRQGGSMLHALRPVARTES